jgi:methionyl-tRNA synthetase
VPEVDADPALGADFHGLREEVCDLIYQAEVTQALERIWVRVRRLNRYVEEKAPWQLAKDPERGGELASVLRSLAEGLRIVTVLLHPYLPGSTAKLLDALGVTGDGRDALAAASWGGWPGGTPVGELAPLFPRPQ